MPTEMTNEFIAELLAGSRTKGQYKDALNEFIASDEPVVDVREQWPLLFKEKTATALTQSFTNAKNKLNGDAEDIKVINRDDTVFLMHLNRVELRLNPDSAEI